MAFNKDTRSIFDKYVNSILEAVKPTVVDEFGNETPDDGKTPAPSPDAIKASRERLMQQRGQEVTQQASSALTPEDDDYIDPDLNYKTPQPNVNNVTSTITTTTNNQSTRTGGGSTTVFADRDEAGQQAAAERAKQKREAGSRGASRIVGRVDPSTAQGQAAIAQNQQDIAVKNQQQADARRAQEERDKQSLQNLQTPEAKTPTAPTGTPASNTSQSSDIDTSSWQQQLDQMFKDFE